MISNIIDTTKKITALVLIISATSTGFAQEIPLDHSHYSNSNFVVLTGKSGVLSFPKIKSKDFSVIQLTNEIGSLEITKTGSTLKTVYTQIQGSHRYEVFSKNQRIGLLITALQKEFNESACPAPLQDPISRLLKNDITEKIKEVAFAEDFYGESCGEVRGIRRNKISRFVAKEVNPKTSFVMKCFSSPDVEKHLSKNPQFSAMANQVVSTYINDFEQIENGKSKLKLDCVASDKASYDPQSQTINLPFSDGSLKTDPCKNEDQIFTHELFHRSGLNEDDTKYLDSICGNVLKVEGSKNKSCAQLYQVKLKVDGHQALVAMKKSQTLEIKKQQKTVVEAIKNDIKVAEFVPVQDADIQEITNPSSPATYQASVDRVSNAMSTNMEKMAAPLNRAIASTVSTARAGTTAKSNTRESISKTTIANLRQPASAKSNGNEEYVVEEILADKYNVPVETIRAASIAAPSNPAATTVATRAAAPTTRGTGEVAATNAAPGGGEIASGNSGGGGGSSTSSPGGVAGRSVSAGTRSNSRLPASTGTAAGSDPLLEQLGQFNEVRGQRYRQLKDRYDDPTFEPELKAKNIAIEYRQNNKTTTIGDTSNTRTLFRDDGTVLKKVTGAR